MAAIPTTTLALKTRLDLLKLFRANVFLLATTPARFPRRFKSHLTLLLKHINILKPR